MRQISRIISLCLLFTSLVACTPISSLDDSASHSSLDEVSSQIPSVTSEDETLFKQVHVPTLPEGTTLYEHATLFIDEVSVPLLNVKVNNTHFFAFPEPVRIDSGYARLFMRGRIEFTLVTNYDITAATKVYPSQFNIMPLHDLAARTIRFTIYEPGVYMIEPNDDPSLAIQLRIYDISEMTTLDKIIDSYPNHEVIYFGPGTHSRDNSTLIDTNHFIHLSSNQVLYIDEGAIVYARVKGNFVENVVIAGHGIISGDRFSRSDTLVPLDFVKSSNISINHISIIDPAAWTLNLYFVENSSIYGVNIISSRANGDGITIQSGKNIIVENVFVRSFDDALVVKNYAYPYGNTDRNSHGSTENITFRNAYLWVDLAQAMEIGYETAGLVINDVVFENITIFHAFHKPVISIHNSNYADVNRATYRSITVENLQTGRGDAGSNNELIDIKSTYSTVFGDKAVGPTEVGNVIDLEVSNVLVKRKDNGNNAKITIHGQRDNRIDFLNRISLVDGVTLSHLTVINDNIGSDYGYLNINEYVSGLNIIEGKASGHLIERRYTSEQLNQLFDPVTFI